MTPTEPRRLPTFEDPRGLLLPIEFSDVPFPVARCFAVTTESAPVVRGDHEAGCNELFVLLAGVVSLRLTTSDQARSYRLATPGEAVWIRPWEQVDYELLLPGSTIIVLADQPYRPRD